MAITMSRRRSAVAVLAGTFLATTHSFEFSRIPLPSPHTSCTSTLRAYRSDDSMGSGGSSGSSRSRRSPGMVPFGGGSAIPGRGSAQDDEEWFAQQVKMAQTEQEYGSRRYGGADGRFGSQRMDSAPRASKIPTAAARKIPAAPPAPLGTTTTRGSPGVRNNNFSTKSYAPPPRPPPQAEKRGNKNSRAPNAIPSGSAASSSWVGGGRQAVRIPGTEAAGTRRQPPRLQPTGRLSGNPKPVAPRIAQLTPPVSPGAVMRAESNERRSPGALPASRGNQQGEGWFNQQLKQAQREKGAGSTPLLGGSTRRLAGGAENRQRSGGSNRYLAPIGSGAKADRNSQRRNMIAYAQSAFVGALVGTWSVFPFSAFHYMVFSDYTYATFAQWEWDLVAASVQGACFAVIYRYAMRQDLADIWVQRKIVLLATLLRSFARVTVPYECAAGVDAPLYCSDWAPLYVVSESMAAEIAMNAAEGLALFGVTAVAMNWLLERNKIARY